MNIYDKILKLCVKNDMNISNLCEEIGIHRSAGTSWKRGSRPSVATLRKIADYFRVSMSYFNEDNDDVIRQAQFEADMKMELFGTIDVPEEVFSEVKDLAVFLLDRYNSRKGE